MLSRFFCGVARWFRCPYPAIILRLDSIEQKLEFLMANTEDVLNELNVVEEIATKTSGETSLLLSKVAELEEMLANQVIPPSVVEKIAEIKAILIGTDEKVPDEPID